MCRLVPPYTSHTIKRQHHYRPTRQSQGTQKRIADYRAQVIAALADNQVSLDELNMLNRLQENIPLELSKPFIIIWVGTRDYDVFESLSEANKTTLHHVFEV